MSDSRPGRARSYFIPALAVVVLVVGGFAFALSRDHEDEDVIDLAGCDGGTFIVAWGYPPRTPDIWAVRIGQGQPTLTRLTTTAYSLDPAISPNGDVIAFVDARGEAVESQAEHGPGRTELWLMRSDGSQQDPMMADPEWSVASPAWSHDGQFLAVELSAQSEGGAPVPAQAIAIIRIESGEWTIAFEAEPGAEVHDPTWSPDDSELIFVHRTPGESRKTRYELLTLAVSPDGQPRGSAEAMHANEPPFAEEIMLPRVSSSGDAIAVESVGEVLILDRSSGAMYRVGSGRYPMWNPNKATVLFVTETSEDEAWIVKRDPNSGREQRLTPVQGLPLAGASAQVPCRTDRVDR